MLTSMLPLLLLLGPPLAGDWPCDELRLTNGLVYRGLLLEETPERVRLHVVRQSPGRPTIAYPITFARSEVAGIDKLDDAERERLKQRLGALDPGGTGERQRMEQLDIQAVPWRDKPVGGRLYTGEQFTLESNAPEPIVRRAAVRLEQIFAAYRRFLPPKAEAARPTRVVMVQSRDEYEAMQRAEGFAFRNGAFFDPAKNRVLCCSDLERLGQDLERVRQAHATLRADLDKQEAALVRLYKGRERELPRHIQPIRDTRQRIALADKRNEEAFDTCTRQLFGTLAHEAFHAYAHACAAPPPRELPRWLNEGLAQLFETAIVEAGELRVGHADADRLARAQALIKAGEFPSLLLLLKANGNEFHATARGDSSDRVYLAAWAVAQQLTFERRLLGTPALDRYLEALASRDDPVTAFETLVGQSLDRFEAEQRRYLTALKPDGSLRK